MWAIISIAVVAWVLVSVGVGACIAIWSRRPDPATVDAQPDDDPRVDERAA